MSLVADGPHFELPSAELAKWLEQQPADRWWTVDGDPLLTGRLSFPCPGDELATELRKINKPLLVSAKEEMTDAHGQLIQAEKLDDLVELAPYRLGDLSNLELKYYRWLSFCWKGSEIDWELVEDLETSEESRRELSSHRETR
jgi:hypothetical protein